MLLEEAAAGSTGEAFLHRNALQKQTQRSESDQHGMSWLFPSVVFGGSLPLLGFCIRIIGIVTGMVVIVDVVGDGFILRDVGLNPINPSSESKMLQILINCLVIAEDTVNVWTGHKLVYHDQHLSRITDWLRTRSEGNALKAKFHLVVVERIAWGAIAILLAWQLTTFGLVVPALLELPLYTFGFNLLLVITNTYVYSRLLVMCLLWFWVMNALDSEARRMIEALRPAHLLNGEAEGELVTLLKCFRFVSSRWALSHGIRLVTSTGLAALWMRSALLYGALVRGATASIVFVLVWITAAGPGYIMDRFWDKLVLRLASLAVISPQVYEDPEELIKQRCVQQEARALMSMCLALQGRAGMHFAGVTMSMQKAISVAGVLSTVFVVCVKQFTL